MLDILPALLWIIAAVIAVNICSITAIRGNLFFQKKHRDVHPVRLVDHRAAFHLIGHWRVCHIRVYAMFSRIFSAKVSAFSTKHVGWPFGLR